MGAWSFFLKGIRAASKLLASFTKTTVSAFSWGEQITWVFTIFTWWKLVFSTMPLCTKCLMWLFLVTSYVKYHGCVKFLPKRHSYCFKIAGWFLQNNCVCFLLGWADHMGVHNIHLLSMVDLGVLLEGTPIAFFIEKLCNAKPTWNLWTLCFYSWKH